MLDKRSGGEPHDPQGPDMRPEEVAVSKSVPPVETVSPSSSPALYRRQSSSLDTLSLWLIVSIIVCIAGHPIVALSLAAFMTAWAISIFRNEREADRSRKFSDALLAELNHRTRASGVDHRAEVAAASAMVLERWLPQGFARSPRSFRG